MSDDEEEAPVKPNSPLAPSCLTYQPSTLLTLAPHVQALIPTSETEHHGPSLSFQRHLHRYARGHIHHTS
jgi:hypothetical protein